MAYITAAHHTNAQNEQGQEIEGERRLFHSNLARMNRVHMVETMATAISHEISQPVNSTSIYLSAVQHWLTAPEPNIDEALIAVSQALRQIERARNIIFSIKTMSSNVPETLERVGLLACIQDTLQLLQHELARQGVDVSFEYGDLECDVYLLAIKSEVQQILVNLIINSIEAFPVDQRDRHITIAVESSSCSSVYCHVADNGPGFPDSVKDELFSDFFTTKDYGTGLGLPICLRLAEKFGGQLEIGNSPSGGATAILRLPAHDFQSACDLSG